MWNVPRCTKKRKRRLKGKKKETEARSKHVKGKTTDKKSENEEKNEKCRARKKRKKRSIEQNLCEAKKSILIRVGLSKRAKFTAVDDARM